MLESFFTFLAARNAMLLVGWRSEGNIFGLEALWERYESLSGLTKPSLPRVINLARCFEDIHGEGFAPEPRLPSLATKNGIDASRILDGAREAKLAEDLKYGQIEQSVEAETNAMAALVFRQFEGRLKPCKDSSSGAIAKPWVERLEKFWLTRVVMVFQAYTAVSVIVLSLFLLIVGGALHPSVRAAVATTIGVVTGSIASVQASGTSGVKKEPAH